MDSLKQNYSKLQLTKILFLLGSVSNMACVHASPAERFTGDTCQVADQKPVRQPANGMAET